MSINLFTTNHDCNPLSQNLPQPLYNLTSRLVNLLDRLLSQRLKPSTAIFLIIIIPLIINHAPVWLHDGLVLVVVALLIAIIFQQSKLIDSTDKLEDELEVSTSDLQVAWIQLDRLQKIQTDFVSISSHELRTPLTVLQGYSDMLADDPAIQDNVFHRHAISSIQSSIHCLRTLTTNLIDINKIENDLLDLRVQPVPLKTLLALLRRQFAQPLTERNLTLRFDIANTLPRISADITALTKALSHILSNAIKYTPDGGTITISGRNYANTLKGGSRAVEIVVNDSGIGIAPSQQRFIFDKFYQLGDTALHSSGYTKYRGCGVGLGLAIARGIVEAHGGHIRVESAGFDEESLPGSHFYVVIPRSK